MDQNTDCIMTLNNPEIKAHLKQKWGELLNRYAWDWACCLTFRDQVSKPYMKDRFLYWRKRIAKDEKMQIGYALVLCSHPHSHCHLLLLGANRYGKTLEDVDREKWKRVWVEKNGNKKPLSLAANKVEFVDSSYSYGAYLGHNAQMNDHDIEISKPKFLRKFRR